MSDNLRIVITGTNQTSAAFQQVARDAEAMGLKVEQSAQKSGRSLDDAGKRAAAFGAAVSGATLLLGEFARSAAEEEATFARLQQAVENTGASYDDYSAKIDQAIARGEQLSFADDQVANALARLTTVTSDTQASLNQMGLVMDFARARGIDLATSADIIGKVMGGNIGILGRYGITIKDGATATEALAVIQQKAAGQAEAYADTTQGSMDRIKNSIDNATEALGEHANSLTLFAAAAPALTATVTGIAGAFGSLATQIGLSSAALKLLGGPDASAGMKALAALGLGIQAVGVGSLGAIGLGYYQQGQGEYGTTLANTVANQVFLRMSQGLNAIIPFADPYDEQKYIDVMSANAVGDLIQSYFSLQGEGQAEALDRIVSLLQPILGPGTYDMDSIKAFILQASYATGLKPEAWLQEQIATGMYNDPTLIRLPSGQVIKSSDWARYQISQMPTPTTYVGAPGTGGLQYATGAQVGTAPYYGTQPTDTGYTGPYQPAMSSEQIARAQGVAGDQRDAPSVYASDAIAGSMATLGAASMTDWREQAQSLKDYRDALAAGRIELELLNGAQMTAADAQMTFKVSQDIIIEGQQQYTGQLGEYRTQLGYLNDAEDLLNQRKAEGIALTSEQVDFLNRVDAAQERLQGGTEDATLALGEQALQYAENMRIGDQLNQNMENVGGSVDDLTESINALIETLGGVPPETKADVISNASDVTSEVEGVWAALTTLDGTNATVSVNADAGMFWATVNGIVGQYLGTASIGIMPVTAIGAVMHGGVVGYADGGIVARMAEAGPELLYFRDGGMGVAMRDGLYNVPRGTYVTPAPETKRQLAAPSAGGIHLHGPVYVYPATADVEREFTAAIVGGWR